MHREVRELGEAAFTVNDPSGLHARPAARFVQIASRFTCSVRIRSESGEADAKSLIGVLGLGIRAGNRIVISAVGADAQAALDALTAELVSFVSLDSGSGRAD
jgi:phosphotransferase system HPr (HPr) family protein